MPPLSLSAMEFTPVTEEVDSDITHSTSSTTTDNTSLLSGEREYIPTGVAGEIAMEEDLEVEYNGEEENSVALMVLSNTSPRLGGYDMRAMVFSYLTANEFLSLSETSKVLSATIREMQRVNCVPMNLSPPIEHIVSSVAMLKYFAERDGNFSINIYEAIAISGGNSIEVLRYYVSGGYVLGSLSTTIRDKIVMLYVEAAKHGNLHVIKWLRTKGFEWKEQICEIAVQHGHLHIIQWAASNEDTFRSQHIAASCGQLEILEWIVSNNFPWNSYTCVRVSLYQSQVRQWIYANTFTGNNEWTFFALGAAVVCGNLEYFRLILMNRMEWDSQIMQVVSDGAAYSGQ